MKNFDELLELAEKGDHRNIDMLVKDIYGGAYSALGLPAELIASSFGKAARSGSDKHGIIIELFSAFTQFFVNKLSKIALMLHFYADVPLRNKQIWFLSM